jgi:hypothetical protein
MNVRSTTSSHLCPNPAGGDGSNIWNHHWSIPQTDSGRGVGLERRPPPVQPLVGGQSRRPTSAGTPWPHGAPLRCSLGAGDAGGATRPQSAAAGRACCPSLVIESWWRLAPLEDSPGDQTQVCADTGAGEPSQPRTRPPSPNPVNVAIPRIALSRRWPDTW